MEKKYKFQKGVAIFLLVVVCLITVPSFFFHLNSFLDLVIGEGIFDEVAIGYILGTATQFFLLGWAIKRLYKYIKNYKNELTETNQ